MHKRIENMTFVMFIASVLFILCLSSANAQDADAPMTLNQVLQDVINTHPDILEAKETYKSVVEELHIAKSGKNPKIGINGSIGPEVTKGYDTNYETESLLSGRASLYIRQNIFNGGRTRSFVNETEARIISAAYEVIAAANRVFLDVAETYVNVLKTQKLLAHATENVITQEQILQQVQEQFDSGFARLSDLSSSKARLALAKSNYLSNQQDLKQQLTQFHRHFGRFLKPEQFVMPEQSFTLPGTVEEIVDIGLKQHPALEVAKYNIHVRKFAYERTKADYFPVVDLEFNASHANDTDGDDGDTSQVAGYLKFNWELYSGGIRKGEKGQKYAKMHAEYQRAYTERRNVNESIRLAWNIYDAEQKKKAFLGDHIRLTFETLESFKEENIAGRRTLLDILNMENEYLDAKMAGVESEYALLVAYYRIIQASGLLIDEYDTGLEDQLGLPAEKKYSLDPYEGEDKDLNPDRDVDTCIDIGDQCDNSITGASVLPFGCIGEDWFQIGYTRPETIDPYITPEDPEPALVDTTQDTQSFSLRNILFRFDSYELTSHAKAVIQTLAREFNHAPNYQIEIIGHTDSIARDDYNQKLSKARANSVLQELVDQGVDPSRLTSTGKGESEPIASNETKEGRQLNRRTEFILNRQE